MGKVFATVVFAAILASTLAPVVSAQVPQHLNHQGILTDQDGVIVPDGVYELEFQIHETPSAPGIPLFDQNLSVNVVKGLYNVLLSDNAGATLAGAFDGATRYLQIGIVTSPGGTYDNLVLSPRQQIASVPYALVAGRVAEEAVAPPVEAPAGWRNAPFEYVSPSTVRLAEGPGGNVRVEIDGVVVNAAIAVSFILPTHLDTGGEEDPSTWYYCYVQNVDGDLTPVISTQAPLRADGTKIGYHPTITDARFVQAFYNDNQTSIVPFDELPDRAIRLRTTAAGSSASFFVDDIGTSQQTASYLSRSFGARVPVGAAWAVIQASSQADDTSFLFGRASLAGSAPATYPVGTRSGQGTNSDNISNSLRTTGMIDIPIADPSAPAYAWATQNAGGQPNNTLLNRVHVLGWRF
jgi:hypothetical protein